MPTKRRPRCTLLFTKGSARQIFGVSQSMTSRVNKRTLIGERTIVGLSRLTGLGLCDLSKQRLETEDDVQPSVRLLHSKSLFYIILHTTTLLLLVLGFVFFWVNETTIKIQASLCKVLCYKC